MLSVFALLLCVAVPFGILWIVGRNEAAATKKRRFKKALAFNAGSFFVVLGFATVFMFSGSAHAEGIADNAGFAQGMGYLSAALSAGVGSIAAGIATGKAASSALGAITEKDDVFGKAILFVALAEGIAIYGLLIAFMILGRL